MKTPRFHKYARGLWLPMPLYDQTNKILIDWSAKGGSVIVAGMFFKNMGLLDEVTKYRKDWAHDYRHDIFQGKDFDINYSDPIDYIISSDEVCRIKIVRNPFKRAVSSYTHIMKTHLQKTYKVSPSSSFVDFLQFIKNSPRVDVHWMPQKRKLEKENKISYNFICKLEEIEKNLLKINESIKTNFDWDTSISHNHSLKNKNISSEFQFPTVNYAEVAWDKIPLDPAPPYHYFYNKRSRSLVEEIYKSDISSYGYAYNELESDYEFNLRTCK